ncbi:hypothetical protein [Sphingosinicella sp.]|uniref:hypothetical protein n=1 Tax=Sphingosinicella sp. TaxID=1917971 RepID=UPI0017B48592|nr:hypothetical protein [Sphingosinicella sp.]MBA4757739.1 hypothetical protein [Sphingosinicella sp.]
MLFYTRRDGTICDPVEAIDSDGTIRDGFAVRQPLILKDRQTAAGFIAFRDADKAPKALDEAVKLHFAALAKNHNVDVETFLATRPRLSLEEDITSIVKNYVASLAAASIAAEFGDTAAAKATRDHALATRYGGPAPHTTAAIRDAARRNRYATDVAPIASTPAAAATTTDTAAIRDQARRNRYADAAPAEAAEIGANIGWRS